MRTTALPFTLLMGLTVNLWWRPSNVELTKVDEIGFTDLLPGGYHSMTRGTQSATTWSAVARAKVNARQ